MTPDTTISLLSLFLIFLPLLVRLGIDFTRIRNNKEINHTTHTLFTAGVMILSSLVIWSIEDVKYIFQPFIFQWGVFYLFFDYTLNLLRKKPFFYLGNTAKLDKLTSNIQPAFLLWIKICFTLACGCIYFYLSKII